MKKEPNIRQKKTLVAMVENGGKMSPAMEKSGYSKSYSKHPEKLKKTKGWQGLLKKYLPDRDIVKVAKEGLRATMVKTSLTEPDRVLPDYAVRQRYLETVLKMKNKITDKVDLTSAGEKVVSFTFIPPTDDRSKDNSST
jgi:hypothetical protein